jgi:ElaB/YqjD/DUF883 family membrane-anchored ribosome-binding protein
MERMFDSEGFRFDTATNFRWRTTMDQSRETLPEGTDSIVPGASVEGEAGDGFALGHGMDRPTVSPEELPSSTFSAGSTSGRSTSGGGTSGAGLKDETVRLVGEKAAGLREQATETVRSYALQGKDRATEALDNVIRMVEDAAATVDEKVGPQYGDYVRRAGDTLSGVATTIREKDVEDLVDDARGVVRSNPTLAIGAAAAVGFLLARIVKAGATPATTDTVDGPATPGTPAA